MKKLEVVIEISTIDLNRAISFLGMIIDGGLNSKDHVEFVSRRASVTQLMLAKMMPNIDGPNTFKR